MVGLLIGANQQCDAPYARKTHQRINDAGEQCCLATEEKCDGVEAEQADASPVQGAPTHAANLYFRRPDLFDGLLALSGIYDTEYGFPGYMDEVVYQNSPVHYLAGMPSDHPYVWQYNQHKAVICVGQGAWETTESTFRLREIFAEKGINVWVDVWGHDVNHDWPWWYKQAAYHIEHIL